MGLPRHASNLSNMHSKEPSIAVADPQLALLTLWATPIDTKLPSPAELLYQCWLRTTIPAKVSNNAPSSIHVHEQIDTCSEVCQRHRLTNTAKHLHHCMLVNQLQCKTPSWKFWVPATVITCPTMGQLSSRYQQWFHILPHTETPLWTCNVKAVLTLSQVAQLPNCRFQLDNTS